MATPKRYDSVGKVYQPLDIEEMREKARSEGGLGAGDLSAGQYSIGGSGVQTPPRPVGASSAPRPDLISLASAGVSGIKPPPFSRDSDDALSKFRALQEAGTKGARSALRQDIEGRPAREEAARQEKIERKQALKDQRDFELQKARIPGEAQVAVAEINAAVDREKILSQATTAQEKTQAERDIAAADMMVKREIMGNENLMNTRDNETKLQVQNMVAEQDRLESYIQAAGNGAKPSVKQQFALESMKGNNARLVKLEEQIALEKDKDKVALLVDYRNNIIASNNALMKAVEPADDITTIGTQTGAQGAWQAEGERTSTAPATADLNNDNIVDAGEERFNKLDNQFRRRKELLDSGTLTPTQVLRLEEEHKRLKDEILGK